MSYSYEYPRGALTVDCVVFGLDGDTLKVLLIERGAEPYLGAWALPGGFVHVDETLDAAASRELREETGIEPRYLEQLYTFGAVARDPRERVVSVAYYGLVQLSDHAVAAATDAADAAWFEVSAPPKLAFDHDRILEVALERLRGKLRYHPLGFELLPDEFTLGEMQRLYEVVLDRALDKRNFRRKVLGMGLLVETGKRQQGVAHRAGLLYRFDPARHAELARDGFDFQI